MILRDNLEAGYFTEDSRRERKKESGSLRRLLSELYTHQGKQAATLSVLVIYGRVTNYLKIQFLQITNVYDLTQFPSIRNPEMDYNPKDEQLGTPGMGASGSGKRDDLEPKGRWRGDQG